SYRQRYGLPNDYPMVAASYAAQRSELAKSIGLGRGRAREADGDQSRPSDTWAEAAE
ncbi:MucR family transcriptional regulator, partial [Methylobacterium oxalidis]|uniref:MucR family transcriptional regulator n=1 Tax=Methylobacterium oxalidis TaxID=944322 RepID=UPI0033158B87